jgi:hypothetical protein
VGKAKRAHHFGSRGGSKKDVRHSRESGNPVFPKYQTSKPLHRQKHTVFIFAKTSFLDSRFRGNDGARGRFFFAASLLRVKISLRSLRLIIF